MKNGRLILAIAALLAALGWRPADAEADCTIKGKIDFLMAGASEQRLVVEKTQTCLIQAAVGTDVMVGDSIPASVKAASHSAMNLDATVEDIERNETVTIVFRSIPSSLPAGQATLTLGVPQVKPSQQWSSAVNVLAPIKPVGHLRVSYKSVTLDNLQSPNARGDEEQGFVAVVNPPPSDGQRANPEKLRNSIKLDVPASLTEPNHQWRIGGSSWRGAKFLCIAGRSRGTSGGRWRESCRVQDPRELTFAVFQVEPQPLLVSLTLYDKDDAARPLLVIEGLRLAREASRESLPIPIRDIVEIECFKQDQPLSAPVVVVTEFQAVRGGHCRIHLNFKKHPQRKDLALYGPQIIEVITKRAGVELSKTYRIDPGANERAQVPIVAKSDDAVQEDSELYEVTIQVASSQASNGVVYRSGQREGTETAVEDPNIVVRVKIRERGPYSILWPAVRIFATIPVELVGLRLPASPHELTESTQPRAVQQVSLKTGLLLAAEPWDYEQNLTRWPLGPRFLAGFHVTDFGEKRFNPSIVAGVAVTVPILGKPDAITNTSLALGMYYEYQLTNDGGSHLLLTFGLNAFSFLSNP